MHSWWLFSHPTHQARLPQSNPRSHACDHTLHSTSINTSQGQISHNCQWPTSFFSVLNSFVNSISKSLIGLIIKSQNLATVDDKCLHMSIKLDFLVQIHQPIKCLHFVFCITFLFAGCRHHKIVGFFYSLKPKFFRWSKLCNDLLDDCKTHCRICMEKCWRKRIWCYIKFYIPVEWQKMLILLKRFCLSTFPWECIFEFEFENINSYGPSEWQKLLL